MTEQLNNFSMISRLFGNLFYRTPTDPVLTNVFAWLQQQGLSQLWALDTDKQSEHALACLHMSLDLNALAQEYHKLFATTQNTEGKVSCLISSYGIDVASFVEFRQRRGMPEVESADHFALLLLTASWIEDNLDSALAQRELFEQFLLPCASGFLAKVESQASLPFYRSLALLCKDILAAMADELEEVSELSD